MADPFVLLESYTPHRDGASWLFTGCRGVIEAWTPDAVLPAFRQAEAATDRGLHAAGFITYEASSGFDDHLTTNQPAGGPLLWFGLFDERRHVAAPFPLDGGGDAFAVTGLTATMDAAAYDGSIARIRDYIAAGDCYQANFTFPLRFSFSGSATALYRALCRSQRAPFCAYIDAGAQRIVSASPELFFSIRDGVVSARPMKGTMRRGRFPDEDVRLAERLHDSEKDRAENVMIVDLLRNDLGRVCRTGTVTVPRLFEVETYETVHQMTSTVEGRLDRERTVADVMTALFPCGSVTGAPKRRSMEIIAEMEPLPRGLYTGCIGHISPGREAVFSVVIRTAVIDEAGNGVLGIGSGVTWYSDAGAEYDECLAKARFFTDPRPEFDLIETMRAEDGRCPLLGRHLARLARSATFFGFPFDRSAVELAVEGRVRETVAPVRLRLLLGRNGAFSIETSPLPVDPPERTVVLSDRAVDSSDLFLYHKTTHRRLYADEKARHPEAYDVLFLNERGELTEGSFNTVAVRRDGLLVTPHLDCGLLPGVMREELLASGELVEGVIGRDELLAAGEVVLINALRGVRTARLATIQPTAITR